MPAKSAKHSAAGPYLGYGLQTVRFCIRLLTEPVSATVYLEDGDDVSVHYQDGSTLLEQTKQVKKNPVANWSTDLWKTIHNWLEDHSPIATGPAARLCLYITPPHPPGPFAAALDAAKTPDEVAALVAQIATEVAAAAKKSEAMMFAQRFLDAPPAEQHALACRFELIAQSDPLQPIYDRYAPSVSPQLLDRIASYALGEAKRQSDKLLSLGKPAGMNAGAFKDLIRTFIEHINLPAYFDFDAPKPTAKDVEAKLAGKPRFIRQLELIKVDKQQQLNAVSDYLRTATNKTNWGAEGTLLPQSLDQFEEDLVSRHKAICDSVEAVHSALDDIKRGNAIYAECRQIAIPLHGKSVPEHFTHGCFNELSDDKRIGWHPNFLDLLD